MHFRFFSKVSVEFKIVLFHFKKKQLTYEFLLTNSIQISKPEIIFNLFPVRARRLREVI